MARRGKGRGGGGKAKRNKFSGEASSGGGDSGDVDKFVEAIAGAAEGVVGFAKHVVEGSAEVKRAAAAFENLNSQLTAPAQQAIANLISPGAGGFVGAVREGLGKVTAAGAAAGELEDYAAQAAFQGMPLDKDFEKAALPLLQARREAVEAARRQAADVTGEVYGKQAKDYLGGMFEFFGVADILRGVWGGSGRQ